MTGPGQTVLSVDLSCSCSQTHSRKTKASSSHMMINVVAKQTRGTILKPHQHLSTNVVVSSPHHILGAEAAAEAHTGSKSGNRLSSSVANRRGHTAWYITATTPAHNMLPQSPHFCQSSHPFDMHTALMFLPRVKHLTSRGLQFDIQSPCNARLCLFCTSLDIEVSQDPVPVPSGKHVGLKLSAVTSLVPGLSCLQNKASRGGPEPKT